MSGFAGNFFNADGGIYRVPYSGGYSASPGLWLGGFHTPNGISFSPDGKTLWVAETCMNRIVSVSVTNGAASTIFTSIQLVYQGQGIAGPDSNRVDAAGNLYQAFYPGGRAVVFNKQGIPFANIVVENRSTGDALYTARLALKPGTDEGYLLSAGKRGIRIYQFQAPANAGYVQFGLSLRGSGTTS